MSLGEFSRLPLYESAMIVTEPSCHAPREVLAGELAPLEVEGVAVGVVRRAAENRDPAVVLRPAELPVVGNVAPHQIPPLTAPGRSLRPERPRPQTQDRGVSLPEAVERGIDGDDVRIDVRGRRGAAAEIARGRGHRAGRRDGPGRGRLRE